MFQRPETTKKPVQIKEASPEKVQERKTSPKQIKERKESVDQDLSNDNSREAFILNDEQKEMLPTLKPLPDEQEFGPEMVLSVALEQEAKRYSFHIK